MSAPATVKAADVHDIGTYRLRCKLSGTYLTLLDGSAKEGASVQGFAKSHDNRWALCQYWVARKVDDQGVTLKDETGVRVKDDNQWNGRWMLQNMRSGKYLTLQGGNNQNKTPVESRSPSAYNNHLWRFTDDASADGALRVTNINGGTDLNLTFDQGVLNGSFISGWESGNYDSQRWILERVSRNYQEIDNIVRGAEWSAYGPYNYNPSADGEYIQIPTDVRDDIYRCYLAAHDWRYEVFDCDDFAYVMKSEVIKWGRDNIRAIGVAICFGIAYGRDSTNEGLHAAHAYNFHLRLDPDRVVYYDPTFGGIEEASRNYKLYMVIY